MSGTELESRFRITRSGWFGRRGAKAGHPNVHVERMRVVGVDKNLQVFQLS